MKQLASPLVGEAGGAKAPPGGGGKKEGDCPLMVAPITLLSRQLGKRKKIRLFIRLTVTIWEEAYPLYPRFPKAFGFPHRKPFS